jgi:hypothetical protein
VNTPATTAQRAALPATPRPANGACTCTGRLHNWGAPECAAFERGEK